MKPREASYYEKLPAERVRCTLCPVRCVISSGRVGLCRIRRNDGGVLYASAYGELVSLALDPIEKKPLYHFRPGSRILSTGPNGCNFRCPFCQNWSISQQPVNCMRLSAQELVASAADGGSIGVAFTYTEPLIWFEYVIDCARLLKEKGLAAVLVSNGYISEAPARELFPFIDAANIDLKSASPDYYRKICRGRLEDVLRTIQLARDYGVKVELTNLLIPGDNDSEEDIRSIVDLVAQIDASIPFHISRYFPHYKYNKPPTPLTSLNRAVAIARQKLAYVYPGNYIAEADTKCPTCGMVIVARNGYVVDFPNGKPDRCPGCGRMVDIIW